MSRSPCTTRIGCRTFATSFAGSVARTLWNSGLSICRRTLAVSASSPFPVMAASLIFFCASMRACFSASDRFD
jgi:hypothetical protein